MIEWIAGPRRSISSIRRRYFLMSDAAVSLPDFIAACSCATVASSHSNDLMRNGEVGKGGRSEALAAAGAIITCAAPSAVVWRKARRFMSATSLVQINPLAGSRRLMRSVKDFHHRHVHVEA